jgi:single-stranded-DNA-specific exonuclease
MKWLKKDIDTALVRDMATRYGIDLLTASVLARRDILNPDDICFFLEDDPRYLHPPFLFSSMEDAVDRVLAAKDEGEIVMIYGDRDADGVTSTALLFGAFKDLGLDVRYRLPTGNEPYGLSIPVIEEFARDSGTLIVTVDCGISNVKEIDRAAELGIDVIVVDHHNPQDEVPKALAIVNPKMPDSGYPFRDLAGCGVAYKFACALKFSQSDFYKQQICLLNIRPANESYVFEAVKLSNMVEIGRLTETLVPGMVELDKTRLAKFFQGQQILVYDASPQKKMVRKLFGDAIEINMLDIAPEIWKAIPQVEGMSLLRVKDASRIARYRDKGPGELDSFINLFISYIMKRDKYFGQRDLQDLQLVALGTLADLMPLRNENRILIRKGLEGINSSPRRGLQELLAKQNLLGRRLVPSDLAWQVTPIINAAGRMGKPELALKLFLAEDDAEQADCLGKLVALNAERKQLGSDVWDSIQGAAKESFAALGEKLVFVGDEEIHRGITGIMASRLVTYYKVPAVVVSLLEDGTAVGSMRSTRGFDVRPFLETCSDLFLDYGGHDFAAGFSMKRELFDSLKERVLKTAKSIVLAPADAEESVTVDAELPVSYLNPDLIKLVDRFEPFGEDNGQLLFLARGLKVITLDLVGQKEVKHVRMTLDAGHYKWPSVFWQASDRVGRDFSLNDKVDAVFQVGRNFYNGSETLQLTVSDVRRSE